MVNKKYDSRKRTCTATFVLPRSVSAGSISVVGDFNGWDRYAHPMRRQPDGTWRADIRLEPGREYHYRYLLNNRDWHVDQEAEKFAVHPMGGQNSVVCI